jgi:hypothetical protein
LAEVLGLEAIIPLTVNPTPKTMIHAAIATLVLVLAFSAILSCACWVLWKKDIEELNAAAEAEARRGTAHDFDI